MSLYGCAHLIVIRKCCNPINGRRDDLARRLSSREILRFAQDDTV
jgi:hypothetical protein